MATSDYAKRIKQAHAEIDRVEYRIAEQEKMVAHVLKQMMDHTLGRMNSALDRFEAIMNKRFTAMVETVDTIQTVIAAMANDIDAAADVRREDLLTTMAEMRESLERDYNEKSGQMKSLLDEVHRAASRPFPDIPQPRNVDLSGISRQLDALMMKQDEPFTIELPEPGPRPPRRYKINAHPTTGMPMEVIAEDVAIDAQNSH